jgi:hypothetical protein
MPAADFEFQKSISSTDLISNFIIGHWNLPGVYAQKCISSTPHYIFRKFGVYTETLF